MQPDEHDDALPSKSQVKRELHALRDLGRQIAELPPKQRASLPVSTKLQEALHEYDRLRAREARRRHLSYLGKLLRREDLEALQAAMERFDAATAAHARELRALEQWRDALLAEDNALALFIDQFPEADRPQLRQLIRRGREELEHDAGRERQHYRALFRALRDTTALAGRQPEPPPSRA